MKQSIKVAFGGIITALSVLLLILSSLPGTEIALPLFAGVLLMPIAIEINKKWAYLVYSAVSILSMFVVPKKEAAIMYVLLLGYYPLLKETIERINITFFRRAVKLIYFNVSMLLSMFIIFSVFQIPMGDMNELGRYSLYIYMVIANLFFLVYDISLTRAVTLYMQRMHKRFSKYFK